MSTEPRRTPESQWARAGCRDARRAEETWSSLVIAAPDMAGQRTQVGANLAAAADPDAALAGLRDLLERHAHLAPHLADPMLGRAVVALLGGSRALGQTLAQDPSVLLDTPAGDAVRRVEGSVDGAQSVASGMSRLRVAYRAELVRLAASDLAAPDPLAELPRVAGALAELAGAALRAALALACREVPGSERMRMAIVAMGKTGGGELNYLSDVDVLFVAEPAPQVSEDDALAAATAVATAVLHICQAHTPEGRLWQVDTALRPEGMAGPLVRTVASADAYYQRWAQTWEFQALMKGLVVAGDAEVGSSWQAMANRHIWQASSRPGFVTDVQAMRRRVEQLLPPDEAARQVKLGPGGLRDVEFSAQLLQLVHGRTDPALRIRGTLPALQALVDGGYVARDDGAVLIQAYLWLRVVEHRVQLWGLRRTHLVPVSEADRDRLARALRLRDATELDAELSRTRREVRRLHTRLFYRPLLGTVAQLTPAQVSLSADAARDRLHALGYADPSGALTHLTSLTRGVSRAAAIQRQLLPALLSWFADGPDPDAGLLAFRRVSEALGSTHWFLKMLRDEGAAAELLARVLATSRLAVDGILRAPESLSILADADGLRLGLAESGAAVRRAGERHTDPVAGTAALHAARARELVRVMVADVTGQAGAADIRAALTDLADSLVASALTYAVRTSSAPALVVLGLGRLGGGEMGYASDADLLVVHADSSDPAASAASVAAVREMVRLVEAPGPDQALRVDLDLRPEGRAGAMVRSLASTREYYRRWGAGWENQALLRARYVAGDRHLADEVLAVLNPVRWPDGGISDAVVQEIRRSKARVEAERLPRGVSPRDHVKLGPGGLSDVEWVVQLMQLQHAHRVADLRTTHTPDALGAIARHGLIPDDDVQTLREAWDLASRLRDASALAGARNADVLPPAGPVAETVARLVGSEPGSGHELREAWYRRARRARVVVERELYGRHLG